MAGPEARLLSRPFPVEWAGWETTTRRLACCDWKIAVQYNYGEQTYRFMFKHEQLDLMGYADWVMIEHATAQPYYESQHLPVIRVGHVARQFHMQTPKQPLDTTPWYLADGHPSYSLEPMRKLEDWSVFAKLQPKEILIPQADMSVVEQLEAIIKAQEPKQHELRQLVLSERSRSVRQIASLAEVA